MAKQDGTRNSKDTESASSADNLGSADGTYTKVVRYCARPAAKFSSKADWELWIMRFDARDAEEAKIADDDRGKELLSLLDDEPFRLVYQNGLVETKDFKAVQDCLQLQYGKSGPVWGWSGR